MFSLNQVIFAEFYESSTQHEVKPATTLALCKIGRSVNIKLQQNRGKLTEKQQVNENLLSVNQNQV